MKKAEVEKEIETIFSNQIEFEKKILDVHSNSDRIEIMQILASRLVRILLKEELSFLYMKDLSGFKFSLIVNLLFREFASEWVSYAQEYLGFQKSEALEAIQEKSKVLFILGLSNEYFQSYKIYFLQEIAETFLELVENMPTPNKSNALIDEVLQSDFVKSSNRSVVHSYSQLWKHIKNAHNAKREEIAKLQIKIDEERDSKKLKEYEYKEELLKLKSLAYFDEAVLRLRNAMVVYMMGIKEYK